MSEASLTAPGRAAVLRPHQEPPQFSRRAFAKYSLSSLLLPTLSPWLASCGSAVMDLAATPRLASVDNFRDVAGADDTTVYHTGAGQKLRRGVIYRSNALSSPSAADLATLSSLGIRTVYDFRTPGEITEHPDDPPAGASETNYNLDGTENAVTPPLYSPADSIAYMETSYQAFVYDDKIRGCIASVFQGLVATPGRHLYHCSGGKDRTGWVTATLHSILGVPQNVIVQDYLLTNGYSQAAIQTTYEQTIAAEGQAAADIAYPLLIADQRYLYAAFDQVTSQYGTMAGYISEGLGLDHSTQDGLRSMFL